MYWLIHMPSLWLWSVLDTWDASVLLRTEWMQNAAGRCYPICNFNFNNFAYLELDPIQINLKLQMKARKILLTIILLNLINVSLSLSLSLKLLIVEIWVQSESWLNV